MEKSFNSANPTFMALCVWLAISWCSICYFIWPRFSPKDRGTVVFPPLLSRENFLAYFSSEGGELDGCPVCRGEVEREEASLCLETIFSSFHLSMLLGLAAFGWHQLFIPQKTLLVESPRHKQIYPHCFQHLMGRQAEGNCRVDAERGSVCRWNSKTHFSHYAGVFCRLLALVEWSVCNCLCSSAFVNSLQVRAICRGREGQKRWRVVMHLALRNTLEDSVG